MQTATKMFGVEDLGAGRMIFAMPDSSAAAIVNRHYQRVSGFNRGRRDLDETKRLRRRDCGLRNREVEAGNRFEAPKSLASKADCTERTGRCPAKSTSSVLFKVPRQRHGKPPGGPSLMIIARWNAKSRRVTVSSLFCCHPHDVQRDSARLSWPDFCSTASTNTTLSLITTGSPSNSNCAPYNLI